MPDQPLTADTLKIEATRFVHDRLRRPILELYGTDNGKTIGTWIEREFRGHLAGRYKFTLGNAARGIDFPDLGVDLKTTSITQPQSSCPFRNASQKVYGLGYHLLLLVYEKQDDHERGEALVAARALIFMGRSRTADFTLTRLIRETLDIDGNIEDLIALFQDRNLPVDDVGARQLAERVLAEPPEQGYLTISNALQWRLQYGRALAEAGMAAGIEDLLHG